MTRAAALLLLLLALPAAAQDPVSGYDYMLPETRALQDDDFLNPGFFAVDEGTRLWAEAYGSAGKSCATCHGDAATMAGVAARYPLVDATLGPINLEGRINTCRSENMGADPWAYESDALLAMTALVTLQSRGLPLTVATDGAAAPHLQAGRDFYVTRRGQLNLACSDCHDDRAGQHLRGDVISQGQINAFPVFRLLWDDLGSRHRMFAWCNTSLRAEPYAPGSPEYLALELYVASRGNGLPMEGPGVRR